jgi:hypothetical protein
MEPLYKKEIVSYRICADFQIKNGSAFSADDTEDVQMILKTYGTHSPVTGTGCPSQKEARSAEPRGPAATGALPHGHGFLPTE